MKKELITLLTDVNILRYEKILQSYVQPHFVGRELYYHSYEYHILRMRNDFLKNFSKILFSEYEILVLLAVIYFHDIVYNVGSSINEEASVEEFQEFLICSKQLPQFISDFQKTLNDLKNDVSEIILSTKVGTVINENSSDLIKIIHDLDYASFANFERFEKDAELLQRESGLNEREFTPRRREFLKNLLGQKLYFTEQYIGYNDCAQININRALEALSEAKQVIKKLGLEPLTIEGGFFCEVFRSKLNLPNLNRCCGTSIYYLLREKQISSWHKVASDEIWYYHAGQGALQLLIFPDGKIEKRIIGGNVLNGETPQSYIPAGTWQTAILVSNHYNDYGLFGAAVFPGFEYEDFTGATNEEIFKIFPQHAIEIKKIFKNALNINSKHFLFD